MMSITASLGAILVRDLDTLRMEVEAYPAEADLWRVVPGIANSGGTLALHLAGNIQHFIGAVLGGSGYRRNRDAEFQDRSVPRQEVVEGIHRAIGAVKQTMSGLNDAVLDDPFPDLVAGVRVKTGDFLIHLVSHTTYHLGQVDYHRRIVTGGAPLGGAVSPTRLWSAEKPAAG